MKVVEYYWDHPLLRAYRHSIKKGKFLFRRGEPGNTLFIIVKGLVQLVGHRGGQDYFLHIMEAGQFLGEKMILSETAHERAYTAQAKTDLTVLELGRKDLEFLRTNAPDLVSDMLRRMFEIAASRLDRANQLAFALYASDNRERFVQLLLHTATYVGTETPDGIEIPLIFSEVCFHLDVTEDEARDYLRTLEKIGLVESQSETCWVLKDLKKLAKVGPLLPRYVTPRKARAG